jgi:hypothetical protein
VTDIEYCDHPIPASERTVRLVDEHGSRVMCGLHAIGVLADRTVEVTLVLTVPVTQAVA